jgi:hypothetical protein
VTDVLLPDMTAPDLLDALEEIKRQSFRLVLHTHDDHKLPIRRQWVDILLPRPASKQELVQATRAALQMKRSRTGQVILLVGGDDSELGPLDLVLSAGGHVCLTARGLGAAAQMIRGYGANLVAIDSRVLGMGWANLQLLQELGDLQFRLVILCPQMGEVERRLTQTHGIAAVLYTSGSAQTAAQELLAAPTATEATV